MADPECGKLDRALLAKNNSLEVDFDHALAMLSITIAIYRFTNARVADEDGRNQYGADHMQGDCAKDVVAR